MDLTMSMFSTPADYWKARSDLAEETVRETAAALGCKPDNESMLAAARDAERYRWLRQREIEVSRYTLVGQRASERLDDQIDAEIEESKAVGAV